MKKVLSIFSIVILLMSMLQVPLTSIAASYGDFTYETITVYSDTTNWVKTTQGAEITNLAARYAQTYTRYGANSGNKGGNIIQNDDPKFNFYENSASNNNDCASFVSRAYAFAGVDFTSNWYAWGIDTATSAHTTANFASAEYIYNMLCYTQSPIKGQEVTNNGHGGWYATSTYPNDKFRTGDIVLIDFDKDFKGDHAVLVIDDNGTIASSNGDMQLSASALASRWNGIYKLIRPITIKKVGRSAGYNTKISIDLRSGYGIGANGQLAYCFDESETNRYGTTVKRHTPVTIPKMFEDKTGEVFYCTDYKRMHPTFKLYQKTATTTTNQYIKFIATNGYYSCSDTYSDFNARLQTFAASQGKTYTNLQNNYEAYCATQIAIWKASGISLAEITTDEGALHLYAAPSKRVMAAANILFEQAKKPAENTTSMTLKISEATDYHTWKTEINNIKYVVSGPYTVSSNLDFATYDITTNSTNIKTNQYGGNASFSSASNYKTYNKGSNFYIFTPINEPNVLIQIQAQANQMYIPNNGFELYQSALNTDYQQRLITPSTNPVRPKGKNTLSFELESEGSLKIVKSSEDGIIEGVQFRVQGTNGIQYDKTFTTNSNGEILIENLEMGDYTITEIVADKYVSQQTVTASIIPGEVVTKSFTNKLLKVPVQVIKTDGTTQKPIENVEFELRNSKDEVLDTLITDSEGKATSEAIPVGTGYYLVETKTPIGYVISDEKITFDVTKADENKVIIKSVTNNPKMGKIKVTKTGEQLVGYTTEESKFGTVYTPVYEVRNLADATYQIIAAENITTADGTIRYEKDEVVETITTGNTGIALSKEFYFGKYTVKETNAPAGYTLSEKEYEINLTSDNNTAEVITESITVENDRQKIQLSLIKELENNEIYPNEEAYKQVLYGVFTAEDIIIDPNNTIPKDSILEIIGIDEDGMGYFKVDLPFGNYYIKELQTAKGYNLDTNSYEFSFEFAEQDISAIELNLADEYGTFQNTVIRGLLEITKVSSMTGEPLSNAKYGVYTTDDELIKELITDSDGKASTTLPFGTYYLKEIEAPLKYHLDEQTYPFEINDEKGENIKVAITLKDEPVIGTIIPEYTEKGTSEGIDGKEDIKTTSTSDRTNYIPFAFLFIASALTIVFVFRSRKKSKKNQ